MKLLFLAAGLAASTAAWTAPATPAAPTAPAASVQTRDVPINVFMKGRLPQPIALNVPVPVEYAQSNIKKIGYSYWMRPADSARATAENLPGANGYMYGSTATVVTYDARYKTFYGIDDPGSLNKLRESATNVKVRQFKDAKHPAVMISMTSRTTGLPAYFMYMSTGVKKDVFFLVLRAPDGRPDIGDAVWEKLAANIK
ncbi:hypothetical protein [Pseudoduganella lutea]|uniref:Uncharacterized protein n=1 Tax=Pseudoduganella lutea TaxID=321985 RepID=A0A4V0Z481_9BURK|nr:hypothetical protein [Pseudoduganella lutea]QBE66023.1 hypothetical protein EWM63_26065 [Pseudoduganella lutea]